MTFTPRLPTYRHDWTNKPEYYNTKKLGNTVFNIIFKIEERL